MSRERNHTVTTEENTKMNDQETQHYTDSVVYILRKFAWMVEKCKTFRSDRMKSILRENDENDVQCSSEKCEHHRHVLNAFKTCLYQRVNVLINVISECDHWCMYVVQRVMVETACS